MRVVVSNFSYNDVVTARNQADQADANFEEASGPVSAVNRFGQTLINRVENGAHTTFNAGLSAAIRTAVTFVGDAIGLIKKPEMYVSGEPTKLDTVERMTTFAINLAGACHNGCDARVICTGNEIVKIPAHVLEGSTGVNGIGMLKKNAGLVASGKWAPEHIETGYHRKSFVERWLI